MSDNAPILILQMQRMGDLILTFPLMLWLQRRHPGRPVWVVAEKRFYTDLMDVSPQVTYFPWEGIHVLEKERFRMVINLSHRKQAGWLAGKLNAEEKLGPVLDENEDRYIHGNWQLYRTALVQNNRHNRLHWADLNALDVVPAPDIASTRWPAPKAAPAEPIGLFLGASQPEKRPTVEFWAELVRQLIKRGLRSVLLGGPGETELGREVSAAANVPCVNLCGKFALPEFMSSLSGVRMMVTPDTGPMHLAAWMSLPTVNLSMGPVNPWETGPYQPGHFVLQAKMSCAGCWRCTHPTPYHCRSLFDPARTAFLIHRLVQIQDQGAPLANHESLSKLKLPTMDLLATDRTPFGFYMLRPVRGWTGEPPLRAVLGRFWSLFFAAEFGHNAEPMARAAFEDLFRIAPELKAPFMNACITISRTLSAALKKRLRTLDAEFWAKHPPLLRPLASYLDVYLQNGNYSDRAYKSALHLLERLLALEP